MGDRKKEREEVGRGGGREEGRKEGKKEGRKGKVVGGGITMRKRSIDQKPL